jgi:hypothetical protein
MHLLIDRYKENESAFDIFFPRIDELRHDIRNDRNAACLSPDSVICRSGHTNGGTSLYRPVWRFRSGVYIRGVSSRGCGDNRVHRAGHQASRPSCVPFCAVSRLRHHHRRAFQRYLGVSGLSGADAGDFASPV